MIVDRDLAQKEVAVHTNPDAGPDARIAAFAGLWPVLGSDRLMAFPAGYHRMPVAELGRFSVASMVSPRADQALAELMWSPHESGRICIWWSSARSVLSRGKGPWSGRRGEESPWPLLLLA